MKKIIDKRSKNRERSKKERWLETFGLWGVVVCHYSANVKIFATKNTIHQNIATWLDLQIL